MARLAPRSLKARNTVWQGRTHAPSKPGARIKRVPDRPRRVGDMFGYATPHLWKTVSGVHSERSYGAPICIHVDAP